MQAAHVFWQRVLTTYFNEVLEMGGGADGQVDVAVQGSAVWNPSHPGWVTVPVKSSLCSWSTTRRRLTVS